MPEHHFPQGVTLSPERRALLLELADRHDALVVEDDYDSEFYFDRHPLPALKATDRSERVIYMGTFSKVLFCDRRSEESENYLILGFGGVTEAQIHQAFTQLI